MRILLMTYEALGRGANANRAFHLGREFAEQGHRVTLFAASQSAGFRPTRQTLRGVEIITAGDPAPLRIRRAGASPFDALGRVLLLSGQPHEIIHVFGHRPSVGWPMAHLRRSWGAKAVSDWADWFGFGGIADERGTLGRLTLGRLDSRLEAALWKQSDGVTVVTGFLEAQAIGHGLPRDRVLRLGAGADIAGIRPMDKAGARQKLGLSPRDHVVVHAGLSAFDHKEVWVVFQRLAMLDPDSRLLLIGPPGGRVSHLAEGSAMLDKVIQTGYVPPERLGEYLACADVMLLPLPNRGFNRARFPSRLADCFAAGRPVVTHAATDAGGLVEREQAGLVCGEDPGEMAEACLLLFRDPSLAARMGAHARRAAEQNLAWPKLAHRVLELYARLLEG